MRLPSLDANHFSVSQIWWLACASGNAAVGDGPGDLDEQVGPLADADVVERVHVVGVGPARLHHRRRRQLHRRAGHPGAGPGHLGGSLPGASGRGVGELRGRLEAPRRADQRPHADPGGLGLGEALDHAVLRAHRLVADDHHAGVGVPGAGGERGLDGRGGEVVHRRHRTGAASGPLGRSRPRPAPSRSRAPRPT